MFTVMSKRVLKTLVDENIVAGWDDPRMPTLAALRRRGYTPEAIRDFIGRVGVTKKDNTIELGCSNIRFGKISMSAQSDDWRAATAKARY